MEAAFEEDIITQLQTQVVLMTSQFCNYTGYLQQNAPSLGPPLRSKSATQPLGTQTEAVSEEEYQVKLNQCVTETVMSAKTINQVWKLNIWICRMEYTHVLGD